MSSSRSQVLTFTSITVTTAILVTTLKALSAQVWPASPILAQTTPTGASLSGTHLGILEAFILGMVQGLTEFIPISSTAHLKVVPVMLGWGDPGVTLTAVIQLGSIAAVLWYFWKDLSILANGTLRALVRKEFDDPDFRISLGILLGTLPILIVGILIKVAFKEFYEESVRSLWVIGLVSIVMGILLGLAEQFGKRKRNFNQLGLPDGILMGCAQALALIPGVSRSGSTITAGLFMALDRPTAARFSFLLGLPAITLAGLIELVDVVKDGFAGIGIVPLIVGLFSATFFSYLSIAWLIKFLQTQSTWVFVIYRVLFGLALLACIAAKFSWTVGQ